MSKKPLILGIESSCDETAASLITENEQGIPVVLSNIISSQVEVHKEFGGVVPELAARSHMEKIDWIVQKAIDDSGRKIEEIDAVASTAGPGLIVCLSVGLSFGKAFASALNKPFIAVNHLEGHALSPKLNSKLNYPYLVLLISGGHSQFLNVQDLGKYKRLGTTIDDALGEAFDKTAKLLGIEFPGGPQIEIMAEKGDSNKYDLPKPIFNKGGCNLSFAGLKTAILKITKNIKTNQEKFDLAASFQRTVEEILKKSKTHDCQIYYPLDVVVSKTLDGNGKIKEINEINNDEMILDIGPKTIASIKNIIKETNTVLWNGPAGYFENPKFANGTKKILEIITNKRLKDEVYAVAGGGETVAVINKFNKLDTFNFVSTAGGAFLEYLEGKELPGIKALN